MTVVAAVRPGRGGNRLPAGHPARGRPPSYERVRSFGPDPERRDRNQRERIRKAADMAAAAGELDRNQHSALTYLLDASDRWAQNVELRLATIAKRVGGFEARSAGRWMHELKELGWVECIHRWDRTDDGAYKGKSNEWRPVIPERYRRVVEHQEDEARARAKTARKGRATPKAPQNGHYKARNRLGGGRRGAPGPQERPRPAEPVPVGDAVGAVVDELGEEGAGRPSAATELGGPAGREGEDEAGGRLCGCGRGPFSHPCGRLRYVCPHGHATLCNRCPRPKAQAPP